MADESDPRVERARAAVVEGGALVPGLWRFEVANSLIMAERRKRITASNRRHAFAAPERLPIAVDAETGARAWGDITALAERFRLSAYAAAYLELALRTDLPLATLDRELQAAAARAGVPPLRA